MGSIPTYPRIGPRARRASSPSDTIWAMPRHWSSGRRSVRGMPCRDSGRGPARSGSPDNYARVPPEMQTSLARRQKRRLNGGRRRGGGGARAVAIGFPLFLFGTLAAFALVAFIGVVGAYAYFSQGLADPSQLDSIVFNQESAIYDRTGTVELATFGTERRQVVQFSDLPPSVMDATTAIEDHTFWTNAGFDPVGILSSLRDTLQGNPRGGSTITQQLVRQRLLDPALVQDSEPDGRTQDQGDHPVDPPDAGLPRGGGQAEDPDRVPQPELLRQQRLRHPGGGRELLRRERPEQADPRPGGHPGRHPPVTERLRPRAQRDHGGRQARRAAGLRARPAAQRRAARHGGVRHAR